MASVWSWLGWLRRVFDPRAGAQRGWVQPSSEVTARALSGEPLLTIAPELPEVQVEAEPATTASPGPARGKGGRAA